MFSIIIPLYNKGALVTRAIDSVLSQEIQDFEIVVIDDGSKDDSADYVKSYRDARVKYYYKENGGVSSARNFGIWKALGDWLIFLDADDELLPEALGFFNRLILAYPQERLFVGQQSSTLKMQKLCYHKTSFPYFKMWMNRYYPRPGAVLVHKTIIKRVGGFDERQSFFEDLEFGMRLLKPGSLVYFNQHVVAYHQDGTGLSASYHPIEKEMAYYIPEYIGTVSFWHKALLYENLEMEIFWWQQHGNEENVRFYQEMQKKYFGRIYQGLHWVRQKLVRRGLI